MCYNRTHIYQVPAGFHVLIMLMVVINLTLLQCTLQCFRFYSHVVKILKTHNITQDMEQQYQHRLVVSNVRV